MGGNCCVQSSKSATTDLRDSSKVSYINQYPLNMTNHNSVNTEDHFEETFNDKYMLQNKVIRKLQTKKILY
jgi:hypothetical protein